MKLIVGLGNPGREYELTRHNVGFWLIERFADELGITFVDTKFKGLVASGIVAGEKVILLKPSTYMNLSGEAVRVVLDYYKLTIEDILIVYDDMDLETGRLRIRAKGSAGGHNGIKSIIQNLGTQEFARLKLGIGRPFPGRDVSSYVLSQPDAEERAEIDKALVQGREAVMHWLSKGLASAMNNFNKN